MIEVDGLTVRYGGVTSLDGMSLTFEQGTCGLIGPNGAGKTTFFNVLSGFVRPAAGTVRAFGTDLLAMAHFRRARWGVRRTFQTEQAIEDLFVFGNVAMVHEHSGLGGASRRGDVLDAIAFTGIDADPEAKVRALGAGQRRLAVGGVLRPKAGAVLLDDPGASGASGGRDLTGRRPERVRQAGVAIVPEGRRLLPDLTVADNLRVASYALSREQAQAGRDRVLELFPQLTRRLTAVARTLSGGEQQMVVLAQALICQPRYLLIDELSLGLAPVVVSRLIPVIAAVAESGAGVLLIEQFATVALGLARHAHIMEGGRIRFSGLASELRDHPDRLRSAYLLRGSQAGTEGPAPAGSP